MLVNQVPNLNHYPINSNDERFGFLPFVGGLAVGALAGGIGGPRPCGNGCGQMWGPMPMMPVQMMPYQTQQFIPVPMPGQVMPTGQFQTFQNMQGPIVESNKYFIR